MAGLGHGQHQLFAMVLLALVGDGTVAVPRLAAPTPIGPVQIWHSLGERAQLSPAHQHEPPVPLQPPTAEDPAAQPAALVGGSSVGPAWTRGELEPPAGEKDMDGWTASVYTPEQQLRLAVDEAGHLVENTIHNAPRKAAVASPEDSSVGRGGDFSEEFTVADRAEQPVQYPAHWGEPPTFGTMDLRKLPGGYGTGSSTLAAWIQQHLDADLTAKAASSTSVATPTPDRPADYVGGARSLEGFALAPPQAGTCSGVAGCSAHTDERNCVMGRNCRWAATAVAKPPKGCVTWYDGCNDCTMRRGQLVCTRMACFAEGDPFCKTWRDGRRCTDADTCE